MTRRARSLAVVLRLSPLLGLLGLEGPGWGERDGPGSGDPDDPGKGEFDGPAPAKSQIINLVHVRAFLVFCFWFSCLG